MTAQVLFAYFLVIFGIINLPGVHQKQFACGEGETLVENECNFYLCRKSSLGICSKMVWWISSNDAMDADENKNKYMLSEWSESLKECDVEATWMKKCNKCWCAKDVGQICGNKNCKTNKTVDGNRKNIYNKVLGNVFPRLTTKIP